MTTITQAALAASVLVGMVSIPAVSETAITGNSVQTDLPNVSESSSVPRQVEKTVSEDGFRASIDTAFNEFTTSVNEAVVNASLENPGSDLSVRKSSGKTTWKLTTADGTLEIVRSSTRTVEKVSTPEGTLKTVKENGAVRQQFSGVKRDNVEKTRDELRELLEERKKKLEQRRQQVRDSATPDVQLVANESTAGGFGDNTDEHVVIVNNEPEEVGLEGWKLSNNNPDTHEFGEVTVEPGERLYVYSSEEDDVNSERNAVYDTGITWEDDGDTAKLENPRGVEVDRESY